MEIGISAVLLSYKEEENLRVLLPQIIENLDKTGEKYEILVIDTAEPLDNTKDVCESFGARYINQEYPAFAGAFKTGIKYAQLDKFLILDSDGSHDPSRIPAIHEKFVGEQLDVCIGSRYVKGGVTNDVGSSVVMSKILNTTFRLCLGIRAKDISTDYRMYRTEQLQAVKLSCKNYDVLQEVLLRLKMNKKSLAIGEVPINFQKRIYGESKRQLLPFIISYIKTLIKLTATRFRELLLYGVFGVIAAVIDWGVSSALFSSGLFYAFSIFGLAFKDTVLPSMIGNVCGFAFTFTTNTYFNFKKTDHLLRRFAFYASVCLGGMVVSTLLLNAFSTPVNKYWLKALIIVIVSVCQFIFNKLVTYKD